MAVKSISYRKKGKGYIYDKINKPYKPDVYYRSRYKKDEDTYKKEMEQYQKDIEYYNEHKGEYVLKCSNNLVGKKFTFDDKKINIIFGPNGSGKTTILKSIGAVALTTDGFFRVHEPLDFRNWGDSDSKYDPKSIVKEIDENTAVVEWEGNPIYYNNFEGTLSNRRGCIGELQGSLLDNLEDEIIYRISVDKKASAGEKSAYVFNKIITIASTKKSLEEIVMPKINDFSHGNIAWATAGKSQLNYFKQFKLFSEKCPITLLFDEVDKSLDITTVIKLYTNIFPLMVEKFGCQIITVSHNPLILSDKIYGDKEKYNIISMDDNYTKESVELVKSLF